MVEKGDKEKDKDMNCTEDGRTVEEAKSLWLYSVHQVFPLGKCYPSLLVQSLTLHWKQIGKMGPGGHVTHYLESNLASV